MIGVACSAGLVACGTGSGSHHASRNHGSTHLVLVVEENHSEAAIVQGKDLVNFNALIDRGTLLTNYFATTHPSLPNYLAMISGSTFDITTDCDTCAPSGLTLFDQLAAAGISWKIYAQGLPAPCANVNKDGAYVRRHVPALYFDSIRGNPSMCKHIVGYPEFTADARSGTLPSFAMVIPDLQHDMHGIDEADSPTSRAVADAFIATLDATLRGSRSWRGDARLVITWDEAGSYNPLPHTCCGADAHGGRIATIVVGPTVHKGIDATPYDHYALLRSIESHFELAYLGGAGHPQSHDIPAIAAP